MEIFPPKISWKSKTYLRKRKTADLRSVGKSVGHGRGRKAKPKGCAGRPLTLYNGEIPTTRTSSVSGKRR